VLANHRDMGHHRTVNTDQIQTLVESSPGFKKGIVKYWESSMKNGFGLIYIHRFFNIPFLQLQRDTMLKQLATNENEISLALQELEELEEDPHKMYDSFIANLKKGKINNSNSLKPSSLSLHSNPVSEINSPSTPGTISLPYNKMSLTPMTDCPSSIVTDRAVIHPPQARPIPGMEKLGLYPLPVPIDNKIPTPELSVISNPVEPKYRCNSNKENIEEFIPDEHPELSTFLDEVAPGRSLDTKEEMDSSSDDNDCNVTGNDVASTRKQNPMVAAFQDDIEIDDMPHADDNSALVNSTYHNDSATSDDDDKKYKLATVLLNRVKKHGDTALSVAEVPKADSTDLVTVPVKDEDTDDVTVRSNGSIKKKKNKHQHRDSTNKDSQSKRKKKKSKARSKDDNSSDTVVKSSPSGTRKVSDSSGKSCGNSAVSSVQATPSDPYFSRDRSDSLERFLND